MGRVRSGRDLGKWVRGEEEGCRCVLSARCSKVGLSTCLRLSQVRPWLSRFLGCSHLSDSVDASLAPIELPEPVLYHSAPNHSFTCGSLSVPSLPLIRVLPGLICCCHPDQETNDFLS